MNPSYQIDIRGRLGEELVFLLADLSPDVRSDTTVLRTDGDDQASLHAILWRIRDLGLTIESVSRCDADDT